MAETFNALTYDFPDCAEPPDEDGPSAEALPSSAGAGPISLLPELLCPEIRPETAIAVILAQPTAPE